MQTLMVTVHELGYDESRRLRWDGLDCIR